VDSPSKEELAYWDQVLHDHNLGMDRGRSGKIDGERRLTYVGNAQELEVVETKAIRKRAGRHSPKRSVE
jgi:hypothetical protein